MLPAKTLQALPGRLQLRKPAALLLHQVILHSAAVLGRRENIFPVRVAFTE